MTPFAFMRGHYTALNSYWLSGRWLALCFPGSLHATVTARLNRQAEVLSGEGVVMSVVLSDAKLFRLSKRQDLQQLAAPVVTDPLGRLHRFYGVERHFPFTDLNTFIVDPDRILRFTFEHAVESKDCEILRGVITRTPCALVENDYSTASVQEVCQ